MSDGIVSEVRGACKIGGSNFGLAGVRASISINNWPSITASVTVGQTSNGAAKQIDGSIFSIIGGWQNKILNGGLEASIQWSDSMGASEKLSGYVTAVSQEVQYGNMCASAVIVPKYAAVDAVNLAQYRSTYISENNKSNMSSNAPKLKGGLMDYIKEVTEFLMKSWEERESKVTKGLSKEEKQMYQKQHSANQELIHYFYELLENSDVGSEYTKSSMSVIGKEASRSLFETILNCLCQAQGSFLSCIVALANQFRLIYVPKPDSIGCFVSKTEMTDGSPRSGKGGKTSIVAAQASANGSGYLPITGVITVLDHNSDNLRRNLVKRSSSGGAAFVSGGTVGRTLQIAPPMWVPRVNHVARVSSDGKAPKQRAGRVKDQAKHVEEKMQYADKSRDSYFSDLLNNWCKQELCSQLLGGSVTTLSTFLDDFYCGGRKKEEFGTGFVVGCSVDIILQQGGRGTARTAYSYSHVLYKGASMPKIN